MKNNQYDLIFAIVAGVFAIGFALGFFFTKREPVQPPAAPSPNMAAPAIPAGAIPMTAALPGGSGGAGGGAAGIGGVAGGTGAPTGRGRLPGLGARN